MPAATTGCANGVRVNEAQSLASGDVAGRRGGAGPALPVDAGGGRPVLDRAAARQYLLDEIERALRYHHPLVLLHIDPGVAQRAGDAAGCAEPALRPLDRLARLAPSELAVILPDCEDDEAQDLIERLFRELPPARASARRAVRLMAAVLTCCSLSRDRPPLLRSLVRRRSRQHSGA